MARGRGQPTKYRKSYCKDLIRHMAGGYSFESFAANVGTHDETLYEWRNRHPDFSDAYKTGLAACRKAWEKLGIRAALNPNGQVKNFPQAVWIFNMKSRFPAEWREDHLSLEAKGEGAKITLAYNLKDDG